MLEGIELLQLSSQRMRYLSDRQTVINRNIANADTPGYHSADLTPFTVSSPLLADTGTAGAAAPLQMATTSPAHMGFGLSGTATAHLNTHAAAYGEKLDGNNVSIEEQMVKANDVANAFDLATTAYKKSVSLLKTSLGAPG